MHKTDTKTCSDILQFHIPCPYTKFKLSLKIPFTYLQTFRALFANDNTCKGFSYLKRFVKHRVKSMFLDFGLPFATFAFVR